MPESTPAGGVERRLQLPAGPSRRAPVGRCGRKSGGKRRCARRKRSRRPDPSAPPAIPLSPPAIPHRSPSRAPPARPPRHDGPLHHPQPAGAPAVQVHRHGARRHHQVGVAGEPAPRLVLLLHGPLRSAQLLRHRREREQGARPLQPDGEDAAALRAARRQARRVLTLRPPGPALSRCGSRQGLAGEASQKACRILDSDCAVVRLFYKWNIIKLPGHS